TSVTPNRAPLPVSWYPPPGLLPGRSPRSGIPPRPQQPVPSLLSSVVGLLQAFDIDLGHLQHRLHDPVCLGGVFVPQQLAQNSGNDLPRQAILVVEPAALVFPAACRELVQ